MNISILILIFTFSLLPTGWSSSDSEPNKENNGPDIMRTGTIRHSLFSAARKDQFNTVIDLLDKGRRVSESMTQI